jgi:hypothetical protein
MKKVTLALVALLASLAVSHAIPRPSIGETEKETTARFMLVGYWPVKPIKSFGYPAIQAAGATGKVTAIFSPKTGREIALVYSLTRQLTYADITGATNTYGQWQPVRDNPKLASWYLKHPRLGELLDGGYCRPACTYHRNARRTQTCNGDEITHRKWDFRRESTRRNPAAI